MKKSIALFSILLAFTTQASSMIMIHKNNAENYVRVDLEQNKSYDVISDQRENKSIIVPRKRLKYHIITITDTEDFESAEVFQLIKVPKSYKYNYIEVKDDVSSLLVDAKKNQISDEKSKYIIFNHFEDLEIQKMQAINIKLAKYDENKNEVKFKIVNKKTFFYSDNQKLKKATFDYNIANFNKEYFNVPTYNFKPELYIDKEVLFLGEINNDVPVVLNHVGGSVFEIKLPDWKEGDTPIHFILYIEYLNTSFEKNIKAKSANTIIDISKL